MLARLGLYGALPGAASEVAGQLTRGAGGEGLPEAGARIVTSAVTPMGARKLLTPKTIRSPQRLMDNAVIEREMPGVQTAGQAVGDEKIMGRELARNKNLNEEQDTARTRVFTRKAGVEAPTITTGPGGTVDTALNQASDALERMANRTAIPDHPEIRNDLANFQNNRVHRPHFQSIQNTIYDTLGRNTLFTGPQSTMSGNDYQHLRSAIHSAAASSGSPGEANALRRFATILDDAMDRRNPGAREGWANARRLWENSKIVEDAAAKVPSGRPSGKEIERSAKKVIGGERFVRGVENPPPGSPRSDYTELSRATQRVMPKLKPREAPSWFGGSEAAGTVLGGLVTQAALMHGGMGLEHAATPAILGGMMGAGVGHFSPIKGAFNAAANRYVASPLGQRHIRNQAFPLLPQQAGQRRNSLILRALAQGQRAQEGSQ